MYCEALTWSPTQFLDGSVYSIDPLIPGSCREACEAHPLTDCFAIPSCYQPILEPFLQLGVDAWVSHYGARKYPGVVTCSAQWCEHRVPDSGDDQ